MLMIDSCSDEVDDDDNSVVKVEKCFSLVTMVAVTLGFMSADVMVLV